MHTFALQLALHFQSKDPEDKRFDIFLEELRVLAEKHGISCDEHQSMRLRAEDYRIRPCDRCRHLTVNRKDIEPGAENMLPDFWFYVRRGRVDQHVALCELCDPPSRAT